MASEATSYFYTLLALGAVGFILTATFQVRTSSIKAVSEKQELERILEAITSEGTELIALVDATNSSVRVILQLPNTVGERFWWARLMSDSTGAWVEGAFGEVREDHPELGFKLPSNVSASGTYIGGVGTPALICERQGAKIKLTLTSWEVS